MDSTSMSVSSFFMAVSPIMLFYNNDVFRCKKFHYKKACCAGSMPFLILFCFILRGFLFPYHEERSGLRQYAISPGISKNTVIRLHTMLFDSTRPRS